MTLVYNDDIGAHLVIATGNTAMPTTTTFTIIIKKPDGELVTATPAVNFTTGVLTYDTVSGDVDQVGEYQVQIHGIFTDGDDLTSNIDTFPVYRKLE